MIKKVMYPSYPFTRKTNWFEEHPDVLQDNSFIGVVKKFMPFSFPIETEEEAKTVWHRLNIGTRHLGSYCAEHGVDRGSLDGFKLWKRLDALYSPTATDDGKG